MAAGSAGILTAEFPTSRPKKVRRKTTGLVTLIIFIIRKLNVQVER